ncbi:MAG: glycosyltransferase [Clostridiales bacterium]|nr:glycosyltransferase [Clostridiales bacterium]
MNNSNTPAISVIIPIYNVEEFLRKGLESLTQQTMQDFEVIMVNDGCTDGSRGIMQEFSEKYPNFHIVDKQNGGVSSARNAGVKEAAGEYIAFLDSDDYLKPDYLERLYQRAQETGADVICCNYTLDMSESKRLITLPIQLPAGLYSTERLMRSLLKDVRMHYFLWNKLWKRTLFTEHGIEFPDMFFEDIATTPRLMYFANKVAVLKGSYYYYMQRKGSILGSMDIRKINDYIRSLAVIRNFLEQQNDYQRYRLTFIFYGYKVILTNYYSIVVAHLKHRRLAGLWRNLKASTKEVQYYIGKRYKPVPGVGEFPNVVTLPPPKNKTKKAKKENS